jgi:hypothetical protein
MQLKHPITLCLLTLMAAVSHSAPVVGARLDVYSDSAITVITSAARAGFDANPDTRIDAHYAVDALSGATPLLTADAVTSATTFEERRHEAGLVATKTLAEDTTISAGYTFSFEPDFETHALSAGGQWALFDRMAIASVGYRLNADWITRQRDDTYGQAAYGHALDFGWTHILGRRSTLAALVTAQLHHCDDALGCHANPYRYVPVLAGRALQWALPERHPARRARLAGALRWSHRLGPGPAAHVGYRAYHDTWAIRGHTIDLALAQGLLAEQLNLRLEGRITWQSAASFFRDDYQGDSTSLPNYRSADRELSGLRSTLAGGRVEWTLTGPTARWRTRLNARITRSWYQYTNVSERPTRDAWVIGGGASADF